MSDDTEASPQPPSLLLAYLRLFRLPNVFTAMADIAMGFAFVAAGTPPIAALVCLLLASSLLYTAGMILNDVYDYRQDKIERPFRPLPSGQIPLGFARLLGYGMLLLGVGLAWAAGYVAGEQPDIPWRSGAIGTALALCVILYDAALKRTIIGPLFMGGCRFFNVLLGMSVAVEVAGGRLWLLGYDDAELLVAGGIGIYIMGVTWFARGEAATSNRAALGLGVGLMILGMLTLGLFPGYGDGHNRLLPVAQQNDLLWPALLLLVSVTVIRRCLWAFGDPTPQRVQVAVKQSILTLIVLDASVTLAVAGPIWGIAVLALLAPMLIMGMWVYST